MLTTETLYHFAVEKHMRVCLQNLSFCPFQILCKLLFSQWTRPFTIAQVVQCRQCFGSFIKKSRLFHGLWQLV